MKFFEKYHCGPVNIILLRWNSLIVRTNSAINDIRDMNLHQAVI